MDTLLSGLLSRSVSALCVLCILLMNFNYSHSQQLIHEKAGFSGKDVSPTIFGSDKKEIYPVAYADFNSDKITDIITLSRDQSSLYIFFGQENPLATPVFRPEIECHLRENWEQLGFVGENAPIKIIGVVAADFNGDSMLDIMVTYIRYPLSNHSSSIYGYCNPESESGRTNGVEVVIFRGNLTSLDCSVLVDPLHVIQHLSQEPLALDINGDMVMDLLGELCPVSPPNPTVNAESVENHPKPAKTIWLFPMELGVNSPIKPPDHQPFVVDIYSPHDEFSNEPFAFPHLNSFADINADLVPELVIVTVSKRNANNATDKSLIYRRKTYRIQLDNPKSPTFNLLHEPLMIAKPGQTAQYKQSPQVLGQPLFLDLMQDGTLHQFLPFCSDKYCAEAQGIIAVTEENGTVLLPIEFADPSGTKWTYFSHEGSPNIHSNYTQSIILRVGDFNLDGFPDLIGVLRIPGGGPQHEMMTRAVLFENVACEKSATNICVYPRTFKINFHGLSKYTNVTMATFFDLHEDGLVDVILVHRTDEAKVPKPYSDTYAIAAFESSPDYDANFMKVMVLSGLDCELCPQSETPYGNLLSGPVIKYMTTTQSGQYQTAVASQSYRSSHFSLDLPYTIFGIGLSPNFIETLEISISTDPVLVRVQQWNQIIPNSQIIIVPTPLSQPWSWRAKLFLTPSRAVLNTGLVLIGFCTLIFIIIGGLQYKERRDDMKERLEEAHRFHMM